MNSIGQMIKSKLSSKSGFSELELDNNIGVNNLIELIVNELKPTYVLGDGPEWETKLLVSRRKRYNARWFKENYKKPV